MLSPEGEFVPGRRSNQVYLNVKLLREKTGGLQEGLATLILFLFFSVGIGNSCKRSSTQGD